MDNSALTHEVIGCAMRVHNELGNGFQELIYQRCLKIELINSKIKFRREVQMPIFYLGTQVGTRRVDFLIENFLSVEIKAVSLLNNTHLAQAKNYLEAYKLSTGLLINFGSSSLEFKRLFNT